MKNSLQIVVLIIIVAAVLAARERKKNRTSNYIDRGRKKPTNQHTSCWKVNAGGNGLIKTNCTVANF